MSSSLRTNGTAPSSRKWREAGGTLAPTDLDTAWDPEKAVRRLAYDFEQACGCEKEAAYKLNLSPKQWGKYPRFGHLASLERILAMCHALGPQHPFRLKLIEVLAGMFPPEAPTPDEVAARVERQLRGKPYARAAADAARQALLYEEPFNPSASRKKSH